MRAEEAESLRPDELADEEYEENDLQPDNIVTKPGANRWPGAE